MKCEKQKDQAKLKEKLRYIKEIFLTFGILEAIILMTIPSASWMIVGGLLLIGIITKV